MIVTQAVSRYLDRIVPESPGVLAEMEEYGRERQFPLIGKLVGAESAAKFRAKFAN